MMRGIALLMGTVFILLMVGFFFTAGNASLPGVTQVSNPEGSTLAATDNQAMTLALLTLFALVLIGSMAVALYAIIWFLNAQIARARELPNERFEVMSFKTEGNTLGTLLLDNALSLAIVLGLGLLGIALVVILLA